MITNQPSYKHRQLKVANSSVNTEDRGYAYDAAWNSNYRTNNGTLNTFNVERKNQVTTRRPSGVTTYDGNGDLTAQVDAALPCFGIFFALV